MRSDVHAARNGCSYAHAPQVSAIEIGGGRRVRSPARLRLSRALLIIRSTAFVAPVLFSCGTFAEEPPRDPVIVLNSLADQMYVTGELSGKADNMIAAEKDAADEIRRYIASGATAGLLGKGNGQPSPLQVAAYMGYPNVVAALLKSDLVRSRINDADKGGMTPWMDAALSMKQTLWACNSAVYDDPFVFVPMLVTQPYYISNPEPPYKKTLEMLEEAGASPDVVKAKKFWLTHCKSQSEEGKAKVRASDDLQTTVQELGLNALTSELSKRQKDDDEYRQRQCTHDFSGGLWICRGRVN